VRPDRQRITFHHQLIEFSELIALDFLLPVLEEVIVEILVMTLLVLCVDLFAEMVEMCYAGFADCSCPIWVV
jgi:hypothetical protein